MLLRVQRGADAAQDICQQVLDRAVRRLASHRGEASLFTWICQITRHELADHWERQARDRRRHLSYDQDEELRGVLESLEFDGAASPDAAQQRAELLLLIQTVLDHLPSRYGEVLEWKYVDDLAADAIAARIATSCALWVRRTSASPA